MWDSLRQGDIKQNTRTKQLVVSVRFRSVFILSIRTTLGNFSHDYSSKFQAGCSSFFGFPRHPQSFQTRERRLWIFSQLVTSRIKTRFHSLSVLVANRLVTYSAMLKLQMHHRLSRIAFQSKPQTSPWHYVNIYTIKHVSRDRTRVWKGKFW